MAALKPSGSRAARCCRSSGGIDEVDDAVFAEITLHAANEPQRGVRARRYKYIRRFDRPMLTNIDDSLSKDLLVDHGPADRPPANLAADPLLAGTVEPEAGTELDLPVDRSPADRTIAVERA